MHRVAKCGHSVCCLFRVPYAVDMVVRLNISRLSDKNLPTLDSGLERSQEQIVCICPSLDSSLEHSINGRMCPTDEGVGLMLNLPDTVTLWPSS